MYNCMYMNIDKTSRVDCGSLSLLKDTFFFKVGQF